jgi:uncharacterized protein (TIGR00369 family)
MAEGMQERAERIAGSRGRGFCTLLGLQVDLVEADRCRIRLPYREAVTRGDDLVHGGAIAALIDAAGTAAAWASRDLPAGARGATVGMSLSYLNGGRGDLVADACVVGRGRRLLVLQVEIEGGDGAHVATAQVTYSLTAPPARSGQ